MWNLVKWTISLQVLSSYKKGMILLRLKPAQSNQIPLWGDLFPGFRIKDLSTRWFPTKKPCFYQEFVDRCENSRFMLCLRKRLPGDLLHELKVGTKEDNWGNSKRRISRGTGIEPAYHKYELGERSRDKYPMDGEKAFLHELCNLLSCSLEAPKLIWSLVLKPAERTTRSDPFWIK